MKKYLLTILLILAIVPCTVFAATTNPDDIEIKSIVFSKLHGVGKEVNPASIDNKTISLDVKLYNPSDYLEYIISVKNNGNQDYYIKEEGISNNQYLKYEISHEGDSYKVAPGEEKEITLRVSYKERPSGSENYTTTNTLKLDILNTQEIGVANTLKNLSIGALVAIIFIIAMVVIGLIVVFINNKKSRNIIVLLIAIMLLLPISSNAKSTFTIDLDVKVELDNKQAMFDVGTNVNILMKTLAGTTIGQNGAYTADTTIKKIKRAAAAPTLQAYQNNIAASDSPLPIYMWFIEDEDTIYWWSEDESPSLNPNSGGLIANFQELISIEGIANFDASTATDLSNLIAVARKLTDISPIANWNTTNNTTLFSSFFYIGVSSLEALRNWDTSNNTSLAYCFEALSHVTDLSPIANWNTSKVTDMSYAFASSAFENLDALANWDTSKVENMIYLFYDDGELTNIDGIANWNTSNVTIMNGMFAGCTNIVSASAVEGWNTSSLINMGGMFNAVSKITSLDLTGWDVSKVTTMDLLFAGCTALANLDISTWAPTSVTNLNATFAGMPNIQTLDLSGFDTSNVTNFKQMFSGSTSLTTIYIGEGWNTSANTGDATGVFPDSCHLPNFSTSNTNYKNLSWAKPTTQGGYLTLKTNS